MPLIRVLKGNIIQAQDINQFIDLLTGSMSDQAVTVAQGTVVSLFANSSQYITVGTTTPPVKLFTGTYQFNTAGDANTSGNTSTIRIPFQQGLASVVGSVAAHGGPMGCTIQVDQPFGPTVVSARFFNPTLVTSGLVRINIFALGW